MSINLKRHAAKDATPHHTGELAAPTGSASPDCCAEMTRSAWRLNVTIIDNSMMRVVPDESVKFCPWCGRARLNDDSIDREP
jgi:hypothetical protein